MARSNCVVSWTGISVGALALLSATAAEARPLDVARIFIEYNSSANDLGFHVSVDAEDWKTLTIHNPDDRLIFKTVGQRGYAELGMTELFFEGAEPALDEFPLEELLALFPKGRYTMTARSVDGVDLVSRPRLSHAVPAGPEVSAEVGPGDLIVIRWEPVTEPAEGFEGPIDIVGYQVLVDPFAVTLPDTATSVTLPPEFVASLEPGEHPFEVLAIDQSGNQTITEGTFVTQ